MDYSLGLGASAGAAQREAALALIEPAIARADHAHSRAAVIVAAVMDGDERRRAALARVFADWERASRERARAVALDARRQAMALAPIGFPSHAHDLCAELARALDPLRCPLERRAVPRVAFGLALYPDDGIEAAALLAYAQRALQVASATLAAARQSRGRHAVRQSPTAATASVLSVAGSAAAGARPAAGG